MIIMIINERTMIFGCVCVSGWYSYCCDGVYCPECSLELYLTTLGRTFLINQSLSMSCQQLNFTVSVKVNVIPGMYNILVRWNFQLILDCFLFFYFFLCSCPLSFCTFFSVTFCIFAWLCLCAMSFFVFSDFFVFSFFESQTNARPTLQGPVRL